MMPVAVDGVVYVQCSCCKTLANFVVVAAVDKAGDVRFALCLPCVESSVGRALNTRVTTMLNVAFMLTAAHAEDITVIGPGPALAS